ncbi:MAG TPA: Ig domain-containing protein [Acidimicrobiales bacterium]|nr:Ig domain-containing protein [Acidimicrobiales bacterium]
MGVLSSSCKKPGARSVGAVLALLLGAVAVPMAIGAPAGAATSWSIAPVDTNNVYSVSCTSASSCGAIDTKGDVLVWNGSSWTTTEITATGVNLDSVDCISQLCVATTNGDADNNAQGDATVYQGLLSASPASWSAYDFDPNPINGVGCVSESECYIVDQNGDIYEGGSGGWGATPIDTADEASSSALGISAISCVPVDDFCMAVDSIGNVIEMTGGGTWAAPQLIDGASAQDDGFETISCVSATFCVAADGLGNALVFNGTTWTSTSVTTSSDPFYSISCTSSTFCMAVDPSGNAWLFDGSGWSSLGNESSFTDQPAGFWSISCPTAAWCVAADFSDDMVTFANPLEITTTTLPPATVGTAYSATLTAGGGDGQYSWAVSGTLPSGLSLDPATGVISGTPTAQFSGQLTFSVSDGSGDGPVATALTLVVAGVQTSPPSSSSTSNGASSAPASPHVVTASTPTTVPPSLLVLVGASGSKLARATLDRAGKISLRGACSGSACSGSVALSVARDGTRGVEHVVVASGRYSLATGQTASMTLVLSKAGRTILSHSDVAKRWRTTATLDNVGAVTHHGVLVAWPGR